MGGEGRRRWEGKERGAGGRGRKEEEVGGEGRSRWEGKEKQVGGEGRRRRWVGKEKGESREEKYEG